ncbi:dsRBD fold-containing protein [Aeromicrobium sp.]|uniref:dsRBD fold-containing protein n=1 Tax=Aeromicrobium sp. TaxID=1871063 RepID=UPI002FC9F7C0
MSHEPVSNLTAKEWSVRIFISEHDGSTRAEARLDTGAGTGLTGTGSARLSPQDDDVPEIGDEIAAARALADLAKQLQQTADQDVEEAGHSQAAPKSDS